MNRILHSNKLGVDKVNEMGGAKEVGEVDEVAGGEGAAGERGQRFIIVSDIYNNRVGTHSDRLPLENLFIAAYR